jgi:hypothetical protein
MSEPHPRATSSSRRSSRPVLVAVMLGGLGLALWAVVGAMVARGSHARAPRASTTACCAPGSAPRTARIPPVLLEEPSSLAAGAASGDVSEDIVASDRSRRDVEALESTDTMFGGDVRPPPPPEAFSPGPPRVSPDRDTGLVFRNEATDSSLLEDKLLEARMRDAREGAARSIEAPPPGSGDVRPPPPPESWLPAPPRTGPDRDTGLVFSNQPSTSEKRR